LTALQGTNHKFDNFDEAMMEVLHTVVEMARNRGHKVVLIKQTAEQAEQRGWELLEAEYYVQMRRKCKAGETCDDRRPCLLLVDTSPSCSMGPGLL